MKRFKVIVTVVVAAAAYFALFGGEYGLFELRRLDRQKAREAAQLDQLRAEVEALRARADSLESDPAALERIARERHGLIRPGERLYRFADCAADTTRVPSDDESAADCPE